MKFNYYKFNNNYFLSQNEEDLDPICEREFMDGGKSPVYYLTSLDRSKSRAIFPIDCVEDLFIESEDVSILKKDTTRYEVPLWLEALISEGRLMAINKNHLDIKSNIKFKGPGSRINILALGDVGSNLLVGLRLLSSDSISSIGIYDRNPDRLKRWYIESNQIRLAFEEDRLAPVKILEKDEIFDCDIFVFTASGGVPSLDSQVDDVRMAQFAKNKAIISEYGKMARDKNFQGIFAVVSDPVDQLCSVVYRESNLDDNNNLDYKGLRPDQVIGYGLGVMNARASYFAESLEVFSDYLEDGRVFGPHGRGLVVANSLSNYSKDLSRKLTSLTLEANKEVRRLGYKPYIAPALSSGSLSLIKTLESQWFYGSVYIGGVFMGCKSRVSSRGIHIERSKLHHDLFKDLSETYYDLREFNLEHLTY